jgi:hypothetical protein
MGEKYWSETHYEAEFIATGPEDGAHRVTP